jgi:hypothetical protein
LDTRRVTTNQARSSLENPARAPRLFEWTLALLTMAFVAGLYLDGWAHIRELPDDFFTPWHAIIYVSFSAAAGVLGVGALRGRRAGLPLSRALPPGYGLCLSGVAVFALGGGADFLWHLVFGIEASIEALYSPPHLLLATGGMMIAAGPLRGAWHEQELPRPLWPAVLSATSLLAILTFFTSESHPLVHAWAWERVRPLPLTSRDLGLPTSAAGGLDIREIVETLGVTGVIVQSGMMMALLLSMIRRWGGRLPLGWISCIMGLNAALASLLHSTFFLIVPVIFTVMAADAAYRLFPHPVRAPTFRCFAAGLPSMLYGTYFVMLELVGGVWWPIHIAAGAIVIAAGSGLLISYVVMPPTV